MLPLDVLSEPVWQRLTWTLLHFLWQGLAVAALVTMLLYVWPVRRASHRYVLCLAGLIVTAACPLVTFLAMEAPETGPDFVATEIRTGPTSTAVQPSQPLLDRPGTAVSPAVAPVHRTPPHVEDVESLRVPVTWKTRLRQSVDTIGPYWLIAWMAGVLLMATRLSFGWLHVRRLAWRRRAVPADLAARAATLGRRLGLRFPPRVCVSEKVRGAIVVGLWRPLVLLPASWLTEMTPEVLEAVIAHELAHVRRWDLWVNLLQRLVETLLFYHPAVWWLSRRVGLEREMCADEFAVGATRERLVYATALEQLGRMRLGRTSPQFGVTMGDSEMALLNRVSNVLGLSTSPGRARWWPVGLLAMVVPLGLWFASASSSPTRPSVALAAGEDERNSEDAPGTLKLEVRVLGVDGKSPERSSIVFWKAVDPKTGEKPVHPVTSRFSIPHVWHDSVSGKTWQPIHSFGAGTGATKDGLSPGDYRVTASIGHGDPTKIGVSDPVRLDGSREHTVLTLAMESGPSLTIDVLDAKTGKPIEYAAIRLVRPDGLPVVSWSSGSWCVHLRDNRYTFDHLAPGDYTLEVFKRAYQYGQKEYAAEQMPMNVRLAANRNQKLTVKLEAIGPSEEEARSRWPWSVAGTVTDRQAQPLAGVEVRAACGMGSLRPTGSTTSDDQGRYTLRFGPGIRIYDESTGIWGAGLQAATIRASKPGYTEKNLCRQGGLWMGDGLPPKDHLGGTKPSEIVLPHKPHRLDFVMVPSASVEGELVDEQGEPIADKQISIQGSEMMPSTSVLAQRNTDNQGRFRFEGVPADYGWWFTVHELGRTQPITYPGSGSYRVRLQSVRDVRYNLAAIRIAAVTGPQGADVRSRVVGDDPSAWPLVGEDLQEEGRSYLRKMAEAGRDWLGRPPASVKSCQYRFRLGDGPPETVRIENVSRAGRTSRQGIHYVGTPHLLAAHPEKVVFRQVEIDDDTILLRFLIRESVKIAAGNGITRSFKGFFSSPLREGVLVLDKRTYRPLRTEVGNGTRETFSRYMDLGEGRSVPLVIQIKKGRSLWNWTFRVYEPGLWLLAESRGGDQPGSGELWLAISEVKVNGQPAVPMGQARKPGDAG